MARAFVFPGQGSQTVGMGRDLAEAFPVARYVFEEVDDALRQNLTRLMFEGPDFELLLTENAQPALMAVSMAVVRVLEKEGGYSLRDNIAFVAGHSLGEYSALAAAGAFSLSDASWLLKTRGWAMQKAVPVGMGGMAALIGLDLDVAREVAQQASEGEICAAANDNAPQQVVVSGHMAAVERAVALATECGAKRSIMLPVSAPFHCALMQPAADAMVKALEKVTINEPAVPLIANITAAPVRDPRDIRRLLVEQITGAVRWRESVLYMKDQGVTDLVEIGAGKVLTGLTKRIAREMSCTALNTPRDIEAFLKAE
ncbi:MAG: ACP S-malonyltransferase [Alphaproteobacteria bacterium]|nr:ACP S-malonyltransferase [Alphaproteobacteria bacterium]MBF0130868.1 ACP S-malonyltransferase [Alphaproteobacteria bacterium]